MKVDFVHPRFQGPRFSEHTLPLDVARDLAAYEMLLIELAKHLYLRGVFRPFPKDAGWLSVYSGDQISAPDAFAHYTTVLGNAAHSTWAVMKGEADGLGVPAGPDPKPEFPSHAKIDFTNKPDKEWRKIARLKEIAVGRGCQFRGS